MSGFSWGPDTFTYAAGSASRDRARPTTDKADWGRTMNTTGRARTHETKIPTHPGDKITLHLQKLEDGDTGTGMGGTRTLARPGAEVPLVGHGVPAPRHKRGEAHECSAQNPVLSPLPPPIADQRNQ